MKLLFSYNFGEGIVSNRLRFALIFSLLLLAVFPSITTSEEEEEEQTNTLILSSTSETDVDPDTAGNQGGTVITIKVTSGPDLGEDFIDYVKDGDGNPLADNPHFKSFEKTGDNTYTITLYDDVPPSEDPPDSQSAAHNTPPTSAQQASGPVTRAQSTGGPATSTSTGDSTGNEPNTPSQQEHRTDPATPTNNGGNGTGVSGNTGVLTPTLQSAARRASNLLIVSGNSQTDKVNSRLHPFVVQVKDQYGAAMAGISVTFSASGDGSLSETSATTDANGQARTTLTLGSTPGTYTVTAKATDTTLSQTFTAEATPRILSRLEVRGESHWSVPVGRWIKPLKVRILDTDNDPVSGEWVAFSVVSDSTGTAKSLTREVLSDRAGLAKGYFVPSTPGTILVEAKVADLPPVQFTLTAFLPPSQLVKLSGDGQMADPGTRLKEAFVVEALDKNGDPVSGTTVEFAITAGNGSLSTTSTKTDSNGRAQTTLTLGSQHGVNSVQASVSWVNPVVFNASPEPKMLLGAAHRPPMLWINSGKIYALVGESPQRLAPSVNNVMGIAVSGNKLYWTQMTGKKAGTINSVNLDGDPETKELVSIRAVPRGIAVDPVAERLYWTNSQGWIQSSNLQGKARRNVISGGLEDPMGIAVGNGSVYWTQGDGIVQAVNLRTKAVRDVSTGMNPADGVAIFGNKVYWTEMTGENAGTINAANLDGTGAKQLVSIRAVPRGIAVDPVAERLYWTNSHGWIQSSDLHGRARRNVAKGLGNPSGIVLSVNIKAPTTLSTKPDTPPTADPLKYDVNGDGPVDNMDVALVTLAVGTNNAKYDVNGDGKVDDKDIALVRDNQDEAAAAAPMLVGMKLSADQMARIEEQIDLLIATGDRSPGAMWTLIYLQQLLATARPEKTQLLANYPNPFNPETWIPYALATDTDVRITIYNTQGVVIRTLQLGQQSAGYYTDRERAAYWDGRNTFGERVASGVYFYQLQTDEMLSLRKMVILK